MEFPFFKLGFFTTTHLLRESESVGVNTKFVGQANIKNKSIFSPFISFINHGITLKIDLKL